MDTTVPGTGSAGNALGAEPPGSPHRLRRAADHQRRRSGLPGAVGAGERQHPRPNLRAYQAKTSRPIPLVALIPDRVVVRTAGQ